MNDILDCLLFWGYNTIDYQSRAPYYSRGLAYLIICIKPGPRAQYIVKTRIRNEV